MLQTFSQPLSIVLSQPVTYVAPSVSWGEPTVVLTTVAILISVISLSYVIRQFILDKQKFRWEMFNKRYQIYINSMALIHPLCLGFGPNKELLNQFRRDVADAHLLLPKLVSYLEEIRDRATECAQFEDLRNFYKGKPPDKNFKTKSKRANENHVWFGKQVYPLYEINGKGMSIVAEKFKPYLQIRD